MSKEGFAGGYPAGVESLMAGRIDAGGGYRDVRTELEKLTDGQQKSVLLLVACDRIYGFFENRGGVANGPRLRELVRELAEELKLTLPPSSREGNPTAALPAGRQGSREDGLPRSARNDNEDVSAMEAKNYYDQLVAMGILELAERIGVKNVFCTVWGMINQAVTRSE